jgi:alpha-N-arabinofuranosidase
MFNRFLICLLCVLSVFAFASRIAVSQENASLQKITVLNEPLVQRPIDVKQGGQFIEPLCNLIPSMLAQQVYGDSFEEEPPYKVAYKAETDKPHRPWYPDGGAVHKAQYSIETENVYNGKRCQKIFIVEPRCRAGISQDGFYLKKGLKYTLRLHARGDSASPLRAWLHGDGASVSNVAELGRVTESWSAFQMDLFAQTDVNNATLTIETEGVGMVWLDRISLIGEDAVLGIWRPDVIKELKEMNPGVIRWGGSTTEGYEWENCIGPWDQREPFSTCWGGLEPNYVGMEEFVELCEYISAEPLLCIRWTGKTPADAAAQVEYFNGAASTTWGAKRASNGHAEPYKVKYWQIGNEVGGEGYDDSLKAVAEAMKAADPSIKILSSFITSKTLAKGGEYIDYLCPHHYGCEDLAGKEKEFLALREQIARDSGGRDVRVGVTEWNTTAGDWGLGRGMLQTLKNALSCSRYQNLMHRYADVAEIAIRSNLSDSFGSGVFVTGPGWMYCAPECLAQKLYQRAAGSTPLRLEQAASDKAPDISATSDAQGATLRIYAVNMVADSVPVQFEMKGFEAKPSRVEVTTLEDREKALCAEVMNLRDDPLRIAPASGAAEIEGASCKTVLDPLSLTLLEITLAK